ncbi:uncharacterized protein BX664DRAFT_285692 [Halteromyces radiatus]|uniref:uncharacterized protein n=1 Tax=Halteromyces radiatus TaxID=101107 RepID=UPI0022206B76|nr:uncharacterized protein BX664DRAFT_285692 [Halteromyces radiatus]KAI8081576.1 hypothetical protein BX664DRAFT_285692 [Halteromyces radiatus]
MATILRLNEKSSKDILLVHKYTKSTIPVETAKELSLEVDNKHIDTAITIINYIVSQTSPELLGKDKLEQTQVEDWLSFIVSSLRSAAKKDVIAHMENKLNSHLNFATFFVANRLTVVDIVIFGILHAYTRNMKVASVPNVMRWFDLVQHLIIENNSNLAEVFPLVSIDLNDVPEPAPPKKDDKKGDKKDEKKDNKKDNKKDDKKNDKKEKKDATADGDKKGEAKDGKKKEKKEKKEKKPAAAPVESDQPTVSRLDIRVGYIRSCKKHEGADSLYVEEIDLGDGEGEYRTIVSGLVKWYPLEEMQNRWVICLANLKPASMRGIKSQGMVLCASDPDGTKVELLSPVDTSKVKPGDRVYFEGMEGEPEKVLNPKKKYWETVQPDFKTKDDKLAYFQDKPFLIKTASGEPIKCQVATVQGGGIK